MQDQQLVSVTEAARLLGIHPNTLRKWADRGLITAVVLPGSGFRRFTRAELARVRREMGLDPSEGVEQGKRAA